MEGSDAAGSFGSLLQRYRASAGLSQEELAERAGLSRRGISDLERGARRAPHPGTARRLADALKLDDDERSGFLASGHMGSAPERTAEPNGRLPATPNDPALTWAPPIATTPSVAELLRRHRLEAQLTQDALAQGAGVSARAISDLERGLRRFPYPDTLQRLARALGLGEEAQAVLEAAAARSGWQRAQMQADSPPAGGPAAARHNLPVQITSFVGRAQETADIRGELERTRLLTLAGPGGVGKTRLGLQVAEEVLGFFRDGVWFVELAPLTEPALLPQMIATVLNMREKADEPLVTSLIAALRPLHLLLILDNCEHVLLACVELIDRLLRGCPTLVVMTTSREVLGLGPETVWRVPPLRVSAHDRADGVAAGADSEAAALFVERARALQPGFALSPDNTPAVVEICERVGGIPLAIELAASRVSAFGLEQLASRLATDARLLISKDRTASRRQQTIENAIQWSYDLLTAEEQALFDRLSVFAGGWTLEAMEAVAGDELTGFECLGVLERLVDKSMVQVDDAYGRTRRYRLLEPLRQFARARLEQRGEVAATHERHAAFILALYEQVEQEFLQQFATPGLVRRMDGELGNLRVALRWLIGQADAERAQRLAGATRTLWLQQAYLAEGRQWLEEALALDPTAGPATEPAGRARALLGLLGIALHEGDLAVAEEAGLRALELLRELGDTSRMAGALGFLGLVASARADLAGARRFTEQALAATQETGQIALIAMRLCHLAEFDLEEGDLKAAQRHAEDGLRVATTAGHAVLGCRALVTLGEIQQRLGRRDAARRLWQEGLARVPRWNRLQTQIIPAFVTLGRQASESDQARACLVEGLLLARDASRWDLARGLETVVEVAAAEGTVELALQLAGAVAALRDRMGMPRWPSERARVDAATARARQSLTEDAADVAWMQGWTGSVDEALAAALRFLQRPLAEPLSANQPPMFFDAASRGP